MSKMKRTNLKAFRITKGLTQLQMSLKLGISESHYRSVELGKYDPSYKVIKRFEEAFGIEEEALWTLFKTD